MLNEEQSASGEEPTNLTQPVSVNPIPTQIQTSQTPTTAIVNQTPPPQKHSRFSKKLILLLLALLVVIGIAAIGGAYVLGTQKSNDQIAESPTPMISPTEDSTADWKTYEGEGFSFKYPSDFEFHLNKSHVSGTDNDYVPAKNHIELNSDSAGVIPFIEFTYIPNSKDLFELISSGSTCVEIAPGKGDEITVGGATGEIFSGSRCGPAGRTEIYLIKNGVGYRIYFNGEPEKKFVNDFLSTFKFTDSNSATDTSDWKTFTNSNLGFSIKYPSETDSREWTYKQDASVDPNNSDRVGFGPDVKNYEAYEWTVNKYTNLNEENIELLDTIQEMQNNEKNVREEITINGQKASLITSTSKDLTTWISKTIIIDGGNDTFIIWNGGNISPEFDNFYKSFKLIN